MDLIGKRGPALVMYWLIAPSPACCLRGFAIADLHRSTPTPHCQPDDCYGQPPARLRINQGQPRLLAPACICGRDSTLWTTASNRTARPSASTRDTLHERPTEFLPFFSGRASRE